MLDRKLTAAAIFLVYTDNKVSVIMDEVNFETKNYFLTKFKEKYGITPLKYRKILCGEKVMKEKKYYFKYSDIAKENLVNIYPTQFGMQMVKGAKNRSVMRDCYVLHIILSGKGTFYAKGKKYELTENQAFLLYPGKAVSYYASEEEPWEYVWIGFDGKDVPVLLAGHGVTNEETVFDVENVDVFKKLIGRLFNKPAGSREQIMIAQGTLYFFLENFFRYVKVEKNEEKVNSSLNNVVSYIREHYHDPNLTVTKLCREMAMNRTSLFKKFKAEYGMSPQQYIICFRLEMAQSLILKTDVTLKNIAISSGYTEYEHFSKSFMKMYGMSPREYREKGKNKSN